MVKKALSLGCLLLAAPGVRWSTAMAQELMVVRGQVRGADGSSSLKASVLRVEGARDVRVIATETAADGTYSFQTAAATLVVVAKADGYISEEKTWARVGPQVSQPLNFLLDPAAAVTGRVTTSQGSGVQGANSPCLKSLLGSERHSRRFSGYPGHQLPSCGAL